MLKQWEISWPNGRSGTSDVIYIFKLPVLQSSVHGDPRRGCPMSHVDFKKSQCPISLDFPFPMPSLRDWTLITGRGATKWGNRGSETFCAPPQDRVKLFTPPLLKSGNFLLPPYNMAKTSSYCVKATPKLFVPPLQYG